MSNVFIAFQANEESRPLVDAIVADNPEAQVVYSPGLVKIDAPNRLVVRRETGNLEEDDDEFVLSWKH
jgi:phenol hydroxylase P2 protein